MSHSATIVLDSISSRGHRLTSVELSFPRIILAEWNTHRVFSRNSASSRAIPVKVMIERVMGDPYIPSAWGKNQKGMSASIDILGEDAVSCRTEWLHARDNAVYQAQKLMDLGVHKQLTNRLLEPFMWHTILNSATEWSNFFGLRDDKNAHPDIQIAAGLTRAVMASSTPKELKEGEWHTPYVQENENLGSQLKEITSGRCARLSYLTHDGKRDAAADIGLHDQLLGNGHMSPLEHAARPMVEEEYDVLFKQAKLTWGFIDQKFYHEGGPDGPLYTHFCGNYQGWVQYRKQVPYEEDYGTYLKHRLHAQA